MRKILYIILLLAELVIDALLMNLAWMNTMEIPCIITIVVWAALMVWQGIMLMKAQSSVSKGKLMRNIALVMLLPIISFIIMLVWFIVGLTSVI